MTKALDDLAQDWIEDTFGDLQCFRCIHFQGGNKCDAFDEIPLELALSTFNHREPYPGDKGIRFKEKLS